MLASLTVLFATAISLFLVLRKKQQLLSIIKTHWKIFIFEEIIFIGALFFLSYIHAFAPDIHGLEKYMDFVFIIFDF